MTNQICTAQHRTFFETFGYVVFPGLLTADMDWIREDYEAVWRSRPDIVHGADGRRATSFPNLFVSMTPRLSTLIEDPRTVEICTTLLGEGYALNGGDGTVWDGDTPWHSDVSADHWEIESTVRNIKMAIYPDTLTRTTGALRVVPGSHLFGDRYCARMASVLEDPGRELGLPGEAVPAIVLESQPGDLIVFDHRLKHGAFGGGRRRRQFCMNVMGPVTSDAERQAMLTLFRWYRDARKVDWKFPDGWLESAPPERLRRLAATLELAVEVRREVGLESPHLSPYLATCSSR